jgi:hypothetical protein
LRQTFDAMLKCPLQDRPSSKHPKQLAVVLATMVRDGMLKAARTRGNAVGHSPARSLRVFVISKRGESQRKEKS